MMFPRPANSNTSSRVKEIALHLLFSSTIWYTKTTLIFFFASWSQGNWRFVWQDVEGATQDRSIRKHIYGNIRWLWLWPHIYINTKHWRCLIWDFITEQFQAHFQLIRSLRVLNVFGSRMQSRVLESSAWIVWVVSSACSHEERGERLLQEHDCRALCYLALTLAPKSTPLHPPTTAAHCQKSAWWHANCTSTDSTGLWEQEEEETKKKKNCWHGRLYIDSRL